MTSFYTITGSSNDVALGILGGFTTGTAHDEILPLHILAEKKMD
jgi:hypothetical protein